ncbi:hypothetical protein EV672_1201 [Aquabacterium commune]|uniref:Uncharacterized protein n=1 Tax=Aquabacterium commune TaxID=70586 RepID=A0A4R6QZD8_9BURK|nr:hypothetical protein EV672_1201 [Aquabacterium commune]
MDQRFLRCTNCLFNSMKLLSNIGTWAICFQHFDDIQQVTTGTLESLDQSAVTGMMQCVGHENFYPMGEDSMALVQVVKFLKVLVKQAEANNRTSELDLGSQ